MGLVYLYCCDDVDEGVEEVQEVVFMNNLQPPLAAEEDLEGGPLAAEEDLEGGFGEEPPESDQSSGDQEVAAIFAGQPDEASEHSSPQEEGQFLRVSEGTVGVGGGGKRGAALETNV